MQNSPQLIDQAVQLIAGRSNVTLLIPHFVDLEAPTTGGMTLRRKLERLCKLEISVDVDTITVAEDADRATGADDSESASGGSDSIGEDTGAN